MTNDAPANPCRTRQFYISSTRPWDYVEVRIVGRRVRTVTVRTRTVTTL